MKYAKRISSLNNFFLHKYNQQHNFHSKNIEIEIRCTYVKTEHYHCKPRCSAHVQLPIANENDIRLFFSFSTKFVLGLSVLLHEYQRKPSANHFPVQTCFAHNKKFC